MEWGQKRKLWIFAILFGAWMGGLYALVSVKINAFFLPNIPLTPPAGGFFLHIIGYVFFGAFLGWISSRPGNTLAGMALGGMATAVMLEIQSLTRTWGYESPFGIFIFMSCTFLPLIVLMMPVAYLIRAGVDAQQQDYSDRPYLWARKIAIPLALTLIAVLLGSFSLYSKEQRLAIQKVHAFIEQGKQSQNIQTLPKPLQDVSGYLENARGSYTLDWNGGVDTFIGPRPAGSELSQFLVIARYENGFAFACVFSSNRTVPNCAVY